MVHHCANPEITHVEGILNDDPIQLIRLHRIDKRLARIETDEEDFAVAHSGIASGVESPTRFAHEAYSTGEISDGLISLRPPQNTLV